jgi:hypothetical protein
LFVGGVAANRGVVGAFERELGQKVTVPEEHKITGCIGAAFLAMRAVISRTRFRGFDALDHDVKTDFFTCGDCQNRCEVTGISLDDKMAGYLGSRCGKYEEGAVRPLSRPCPP